MNGWVKLHRKISENIFLMKDNNAFMVFTRLLMMANSKGEVGSSGRELAKKVNLNYSTLYKALARLEGEAMIKQSSKHKYTVITICNWEKYQETGKHYGKQMVSGREADGKRLTEVARIENKNKEKPVAKNDGTGFRTYMERRKQLGL